jgi:hypothetical protein
MGAAEMRVWLGKPLPFGMWLATCFVIGLLVAGGYWLYTELKANRVAAIEQLCMHDNANAEHNIDFLRIDVRADPSLLAKAQARFKQTPDCHAFAVKAVHARP